MASNMGAVFRRPNANAIRAARAAERKRYEESFAEGDKILEKLRADAKSAESASEQQSDGGNHKHGRKRR